MKLSGVSKGLHRFREVPDLGLGYGKPHLGLNHLRKLVLA
jgi:hypothetical protein